MSTAIIHRQQRTDRIPTIAKLLARFPDAQILEAKVPGWERNPHATAMRGCAVSHLSAAKALLTPNEPLIVLEDDAEFIEGAALPDFSKAPADAGLILLGADADQYGDDYGTGFREVLPKFYGTQAVAYMPRLLRSPYLLNAFERMATAPMGAGPGEVCTESLLLLAAMDSGLKIYRPTNMVFTTVPSVSDSRGTVEAPRNLAYHATDRDGLLPAETWNDIFAQWDCMKAHLLAVPGNPGDQLLNAAARQLMAHNGVVESSLEDADVLFWPAGGNIGGQYDFREAPEVFLNFKKTRVVLPQSIMRSTPALEAADEVWLRDDESQKLFPSGRRAPDLALAYRPSLSGNHELGAGVFFRQDAEATSVPAENFADPVAGCRTHYDYLRLAGSYSTLVTNRLHFAIAGLIMGAAVTLHPNAYHKNRSVWDANLKDLGCGFAD